VKRGLLVGSLVVALVAVGALAAVGWVYSDELTRPAGDVTYDLEVLDVAEDTVTVTGGRDQGLPGTYGLAWPDGFARVGELVSRESVGDQQLFTRELLVVERGTLQVGQPVRWEQAVFAGDPRTVHGLAFDEVTFRSDVGDLPAWVVPPAGGAGDTWAIAVHGRGGSRAEALRILPTLHEAGLTTMVITYRNDRDAPPSPDRRYHLGDSEWQDVEAAMAWARQQGAERFVLVGWSMGGATVLQALDRAADAALVERVVLDSPAVDWAGTLQQQARNRGLPAWLATPTILMAQGRFGIDFDRLDWVARAGELSVPILLFHGPDDLFVPWEGSREIARTRPDLVTLEVVDGAEHTKSWNVDPARYEDAVAEFLAPVASPQGAAAAG
jgi:hypothetical protein